MPGRLHITWGVLPAGRCSNSAAERARATPNSPSADRGRGQHHLRRRRVCGWKKWSIRSSSPSLRLLYTARPNGLSALSAAPPAGTEHRTGPGRTSSPGRQAPLVSTACRDVRRPHGLRRRDAHCDPALRPGSSAGPTSLTRRTQARGFGTPSILGRRARQPGRSCGLGSLRRGPDEPGRSPDSKQINITYRNNVI